MDFVLFVVAEPMLSSTAVTREPQSMTIARLLLQLKGQSNHEL